MTLVFLMIIASIAHFTSWDGATDEKVIYATMVAICLDFLKWVLG